MRLGQAACYGWCILQFVHVTSFGHLDVCFLPRNVDQRAVCLLQSNELGFLVSLAGQGECFSAHKFQDFYQDRVIQFATL
jgi:hypothetical protein